MLQPRSVIFMQWANLLFIFNLSIMAMCSQFYLFILVGMTENLKKKKRVFANVTRVVDTGNWTILEIS
jgi:hypothetical protein